MRTIEFHSAMAVTNRKADFLHIIKYLKCWSILVFCDNIILNNNKTLLGLCYSLWNLNSIWRTFIWNDCNRPTRNKCLQQCYCKRIQKFDMVCFSLLTALIHKSASNETSYYMHNTSVIADYNNKRTRTIRFDKILKHNVQYIHKYIRCSNIEDNLILSP